MAYRKVQDTFWTDPEIEEFTPEQKFFYLYLITNPNCNQIGLYEFSVGHASLHTGYNRETITKLLDFFEKNGKIKRSSTTKEMVVCKFYYHNKSKSNLLKIHCDKLLNEVKDKGLIQYIYSMDTVSIGYRQEEEEKEEEKEEEGLEKNSDGIYEIPINRFKNFNQCKESILQDEVWHMQLCRSKSITRSDLILNLTTFFESLKDADDIYKPEKEIRRHFANWLNKNLKPNQNTQTWARN